MFRSIRFAFKLILWLKLIAIAALAGFAVGTLRQLREE